MHDHHQHLFGDNRQNTPANQNKTRMLFVFGLTATYMLAEVWGAWFTGSLALLADAGHMLTDTGALGLALLAIWFSEKPANERKTYGYYRLEILAALLNALLLLGVSFYILFEAWQRLKNPPEIVSIPMLVIASLGLIINLISIKILSPAAEHSLNMKGAYLEVLADMVASIGVIATGLIMHATHWYWADPIASIGIGLWIFPRTWKLLNQSIHILMEGTPAHIDIHLVEQNLKEIAGVNAVHDLHVWTITSGVDALSAHVSIDQYSQGRQILADVQHLLKEKFRIEHITIQLEDQQCEKH